MWCSRRFREHVIGELDHLHDDIIELTRLVRLDLGEDMATNDELEQVSANLDEAQSELQGLPAQIAELVAQAGDAADPALVESILAKSKALADIVPAAAEPTPEPAPEPEPAPTDGGDTPVEPEPTPEA